ncbi:hypothetical protein K7X08_001150 [Anisodus acutangulus]|uniref:Uncharacterized protein n=1 Tax=Anisodus acutangulus TaxID=402998 RepID=A0A9Q1MNE2_9SOLA|nr:hypothetical protein K7X08_001150 [Anisodus acutangulus]
MPEKETNTGVNGDDGKNIEDPSNGKQVVANPSHEKQNPSSDQNPNDGVIKILQSEKVISNVNDIHKSQTQIGKKQKNNNVDGQKQLTLHGVKNGDSIAATGNPKSGATDNPSPNILGNGNKFAALGEGSSAQENDVEDVAVVVHVELDVIKEVGNEKAILDDGQQVHGTIEERQMVEVAVPMEANISEKPLNPNAKVYTPGKKKFSPGKTKQWVEGAFAKPTDVVVPTNMSCQDIPSNSLDTNTCTDGVERRLWSEQVEKAVENGEIADDKVDEQEQLSDLITSSQEVHAMFDKVVEEEDDTNTSHAIVEAAKGVRIENCAEERIEDHVNTNSVVPHDGVNMQKQGPNSKAMQTCSKEVNKSLAKVQEEIIQRAEDTCDSTPCVDAQKQEKPPDVTIPSVGNRSSVKKQTKGTKQTQSNGKTNNKKTQQDIKKCKASDKAEARNDLDEESTTQNFLNAAREGHLSPKQIEKGLGKTRKKASKYIVPHVSWVQTCSKEEEIIQRAEDTCDLTPCVDAQKQEKPPDVTIPSVGNQSSAKKQTKGTKQTQSNGKTNNKKTQQDIKKCKANGKDNMQK